MLRGFYQAIRNPRSHEKLSDSETEAQALLLFISYVVAQIDKGRAQFSRSDFLNRVLDPDFVPKQRYAQLLVQEIPAGRRVDVFLDVYNSKDKWQLSNIQHFFAVLLKELTPEQLSEVYGIISEELKTAEDENVIRPILGAFDGSIWPHLEEVSRLRIENRLIRSMREGRYVVKERRCRGGTLGTWATRYLPYFTLKNEG